MCRRHSKPEPFWRELIDLWKASRQAIAASCAANREKFLAGYRGFLHADA